MAPSKERFPFLSEMDSKLQEILKSHQEDLLRSEFCEAYPPEKPATILLVEMGEFWYSLTRLPRPPEKLSDSQRKIANLAADGLANRDIARMLGVKTPTVASQLARIFRKLKVHSRVELASRRPWYA
jgi:DNA-binding NarL/FixJ family response regulator